MQNPRIAPAARRLPALCLPLLAALAGCEAEPLPAADMAPLTDTTAEPEPTPDLAPDPEPDAAPDPEPDAAPADAAFALDLGPDAAPLDAAPADGELPDGDLPDAAPDLGPADAEPDARHMVDPLPDAGLDLDWIEVACEDPAWMAGMCVAGEGRRQENAGAGHIAEEQPIEYAEIPPASGDHRSRWGRWGEYSYMPPQRYLHNLEHGGIAFLYHPCVEDEVVDALRALARARPEDETGAFRWVLTPYPDLPSAIAVVAWEWVYSAECVRPDEIGGFIDRYYRMAPEDVRSDGSYERGWIGR